MLKRIATADGKNGATNLSNLPDLSNLSNLSFVGPSWLLMTKGAWGAIGGDAPRDPLMLLLHSVYSRRLSQP